MSKLKIGIIEDNEIILERYRDYINQSELSECVIAVDSVERFLKFYRPFMEFDLILLDINLSGISGLEGIELIKNKLPNVDIIMFTIVEDSDVIFKSLRLGAVGYLLKDLSKVELERQFLLIQQGGVAVSPPIARKIIEYFSPNKQYFSLHNKNKLSKKENQIVNLLIDGLTYNEISDNLNMSINGVRYHIKNIYKKLQVKSRSEVYRKFLDSDNKLEDNEE